MKNILNSQEKKLMVSSILSTPLNLLTSFMTFLLSLWVIRNIPINTVSIFIAFQAFSTIISLAFIGFQNILIRNTIIKNYKKNNSLIFKNSQINFILFSSIFSLIVLISISFTNSIFGISKFLVILISVVPLISCFFTLIGANLISRGKLVTFSLFILMNLMMSIIVLIIIDYFKTLTIELLIFILILCNFISSLLGFFVFKVLNSFNSNLFSSLSMRIFFYTLIIAFIANFDTLLSGLYIGSSQRNAFSVAAILIKSSFFFIQALNSAVYVLLLNRLQAKRSVEKIHLAGIYFIFFTISFIALFLIIFGENLIPFLYGEEFKSSSVFILPLFICNMPIIFISFFSQFILRNPSWNLILLLITFSLTSFLVGFLVVNDATSFIFLVFILNIFVLLTLMIRYYKTKNNYLF